MDLYYPVPSKHTEPCFILCPENHVLSYDVGTHKTVFFKYTTIYCLKKERLSFLVNPNPNPNPNSNPNTYPYPNPYPNRKLFLYTYFSWIMHNIWKLFSLSLTYFFKPYTA